MAYPADMAAIRHAFAHPPIRSHPSNARAPAGAERLAARRAGRSERLNRQALHDLHLPPSASTRSLSLTSPDPPLRSAPPTPSSRVQSLAITSSVSAEADVVQGNRFDNGYDGLRHRHRHAPDEPAIDRRLWSRGDDGPERIATMADRVEPGHGAGNGRGRRSPARPAGRARSPSASPSTPSGRSG
jgi:hypothetical protein